MSLKNIHEHYLADMAESSQDKNMLMRIAQKEKEHYDYLKQMLEK